MSLLEDQRALWEHVMRGGPAEPLQARLSGPPTRASLAREMVAVRFVEAVRAELPMTSLFLGDTLPDHVARLVREHPSRDPDLGKFPRALVHQLEGAARSLASLEVARAESFESPDAESAAISLLSELPPDRLPAVRFQFTPSVRLLTLEPGITETWRALDAGQSPPGPSSPEHVVVWRRGWDVFHSRISPEESAALGLASTGAPFADVLACFAELPESLQAAWQAVGSWFGEGMVASIEA